MPSLFQVTTLTIPLLSYALYQYANSGPYLSTTCALFRYGCPTDIPVHGFYDKAYQEAYDLFLENFKQGLDVGAGLSVYVDGVSVINVQAGWQDIENKIEYTNKTLQMVFSCTKTLSAILIAQLVEQNLLSYDEKISTYWPEFAQGKKENVTVMDLMRHTAGVGALDYPISLANVTDPVTFANILASQPHNFDGVPTHAYHAITQGWYQNEIVRRVTGGKTLDDLARTLKDKYGSEWYLKPDVTEGVDTSRIAPFYEQPILHQLAPFLRIYLNPFADKTFIRNIFDKDSLFTRSLVHANIDQQRGVMNNRDPIRRAIEGPSYSGHTNAESIAKLAAMMANEGKAIVPGEPDLISKKTFKEATQYVASEVDVLFPDFPFDNQKGGFIVFPNGPYFNISDNESHFEGGFGADGSLFIYNRKYKIGLGYVTNGYAVIPGHDKRNLRIVKSIFEQVKKQKAL